MQSLLGTPATTAIFDNETWYYISSHTTQYAFFPTTELDRTIYAVSFDEQGILKDVRRLTMKDGKPIQIAGRETPSKGREYSVIEQLIGNLGRFSGRKETRPQVADRVWRSVFPIRMRWLDHAVIAIAALTAAKLTGVACPAARGR